MFPLPYERRLIQALLPGQQARSALSLLQVAHNVVRGEGGGVLREDYLRSAELDAVSMATPSSLGEILGSLPRPPFSFVSKPLPPPFILSLFFFSLSLSAPASSSVPLLSPCQPQE